MRILVYDTHSFERETFCQENSQYHHDLTFLDVKLSEKTASLSKGFEAVCAFVNDRLDRPVLMILKEAGVKLLALRSAGFNHVDLATAKEVGLKVVRVPEYSPFSVAEFAVSLILTLNRKIHRSYNRVRECNFSLDGLVGFDLHGKTIGVVGTGKIGRAFVRIMRGFQCEVLAYDVFPDAQLEQELGIKYLPLKEVLNRSDVISLHLPLTKESTHLIDDEKISWMKDGVMLINTSRGKIIDTKALIRALKTKKIGAAGLDVYEEEESVFFEDHSGDILSDDVLMRLMTFPNVILTGHQAFLTKEALTNIAETTLKNVSDFEQGGILKNEVGLA